MQAMDEDFWLKRMTFLLILTGRCEMLLLVPKNIVRTKKVIFAEILWLIRHNQNRCGAFWTLGNACPLPL